MLLYKGSQERHKSDAVRQKPDNWQKGLMMFIINGLISFIGAIIKMIVQVAIAAVIVIIALGMWAQAEQSRKENYLTYRFHGLDKTQAQMLVKTDWNFCFQKPLSEDWTCGWDSSIPHGDMKMYSIHGIEEVNLD